MKYEKSDIVKLIQKAVFEVTKIQVDSVKKNLLDRDIGICSADFLYVFDFLERELHVSVADILVGRSYHVMEIDNMCDALLELLE